MHDESEAADARPQGKMHWETCRLPEYAAEVVSPSSCKQNLVFREIYGCVALNCIVISTADERRRCRSKAISILAAWLCCYYAVIYPNYVVRFCCTSPFRFAGQSIKDVAYAR
ncbi:uncharacterized protein M421DRAFT_299130 [Didymella exigua CBS 183.55]|uniref:Uncharacterized protein n=1 Tax=Didymella exigua CBS 183.55 TaxID=1150837 RepID=A0A6A5R9K5_9PLEO|nr:uncharacterized protein M421DRAFT_299130 [Didymella exigua CBS 183.55]KAF1924009.1 hypothetical protein M421DRAFT_299130 [Didymella exigua CBS 183.55]